MTPGERILTARRQRGMSQNQLARHIGTTDKHVSAWEHGRGKPDFENLRKLCQALDVRADWLLGLEKGMGWYSGTKVFDPVVRKLLSMATITPDDQQELIVALIDALEERDWDCQSNSAYYEHPLVKAALLELHPDWFDDWENGAGLEVD